MWHRDGEEEEKKKVISGKVKREICKHSKLLRSIKNSPLLGENMPNIKQWSDIAPCNTNRVLPYESILCLSNSKTGREARNYTAVWKTLENVQNGIQYTVSALVRWLYLVVLVFGGSKQITASPVRERRRRKKKKEEEEGGAFICLPRVTVPGAEAENDCDTMPVINISGARQVRTTNLTG